MVHCQWHSHPVRAEGTHFDIRVKLSQLSSRLQEVWFIVNGIPIRYGLREHTLISGLNCHNYPLGYKECGGTKFVDRHFKEGEFRRSEDVKAKLVNMGPHRDRLKMSVLFFLGSVMMSWKRS